MFEIDTHRVILQLLDGEGSGSTESVINSLISIFLLTVGVLSLCGSLFIIISFLLLRDWTFPNNLIFVLSLCDFFWTGTYFALFNLQVRVFTALLTSIFVFLVYSKHTIMRCRVDYVCFKLFGVLFGVSLLPFGRFSWLSRIGVSFLASK